jgi:ribosomal protein L37AE/L43A
MRYSNPEDPRERYWRQVRDLADEHEVPVSEARTLWRRFYKKGGIRRMMLALSARVTSSPTVCPFCRDELPLFPEHEPVWTCSSCSTKLHQECFDELGRCTTLGCRTRAVRPTARPRVTPRVQEVEEGYTLYRRYLVIMGGLMLIALFALGIAGLIWWLLG